MNYSKVRDVKSPVRGTAKSAGIDFFVPSSFKEVMLRPNEDLLIPSGIRMKVPENFMLMAAEKSGVVTSRQACSKAGRTAKPEAFNSVVVLGAKIVDEDYQGEIHIHVINVGQAPVYIKPDFKIAQFILVPVSYETLNEVPDNELFSENTERGDKGFGLGTGNK